MKKVDDKTETLGKQITFSKYSIELDPFDIENFEEIKVNNPSIQKTSEEGTQDYEQFPELHQDLFSSLYRYQPELLSENKVAADSLLNREVMDNIMKTDKYQELRNLTKLDKVNSTIATEIMGDEVKSLVKDLKKEIEDMQGNGEGEGEGQGEGEGEEGEGDGSGNGKGKVQQKHTLEEAQKMLKQAKEAVTNSMKKRETKSRLNNMMDKAVKQTVETSDMISNWGLEGDHSFMRKPYQEKMKVLKKLKESSKLRHIAKLAGKFRAIAAKKEREKVKRGFNEIYDITRGNDMTRVLPSEALKLKNPSTRRQFMKDFADQSLLQYQIEGKESKGKGAIVCCIDSSGSMHGPPEVWAKAVALALLDVALLQKRNFFCIHFDHTDDPKHLHTNCFLKTQPHSIEEVIDMAEYFVGGGTLFEPALELARTQIDQEDAFRKADIVFITDGQSAITQEFCDDFNAWRKKRNVKVYSILIDAWDNSDAGLGLFSDEITKLNNINGKGTNTAINIFESI